MSDSSTVRDAVHPWRAEPAGESTTGTPPKSYRVKIFKSGNSMALRLPAELGLVAGSEMHLRVEDGGYRLEPVDAPKRKIDLTGIAGTVPWLKPRTPEEREFEDSPRVWDDPDWPGWKTMSE